MLPFYLWFILAGSLLTIMALASSFLKRVPLSTSFIYLGAGVLVGPLGLGLLVFNPLDEFAVTFLERFSETVVVLSLFAAGLKMRVPLTDRIWRLPLRLALVSMTVTVGLVTLIGVYLLGLPLGAAVLLGAVLAPTDPVLASDVQIEGTHDTDPLRFSLTGEAGFNDGTAFPFVMLGLGLMGLRDLGAYGWRWFAIDVVWAVVAGLAVGAVLGVLTGRLVIYLRRTHKEAVGLDDFLALGLVFLAYGLTLMINAYAFLAAFAAGYALRAVERYYNKDDDAAEDVVAVAGQGGSRGNGGGPGKSSCLYGLGRVGLYRAVRAYRHGGHGRFNRWTALLCQLVLARSVVCSHHVFGGASDSGLDWFIRLRREKGAAQSDCLVWDSRYRLSLLPDVRRSSWFTRGRRCAHPFAYPAYHRRQRSRTRQFGDAAYELVSAEVRVKGDQRSEIMEKSKITKCEDWKKVPSPES